MDKYTVLLVDDEEDVIQVIMKKLNWEELGFSVIGYAGNGVKALELMEEYQPDVVVTDIKMPYMDGMELAQRIKSEFPMTKILIFTGFDEFEYAREAVHLEVEEYILKPVNSMELTEVFKVLKSKLDQEISEKQNVEILQKYYLESLPLRQANFYSMLMEGRVCEEEIERYLSECRLSFPGPFFCCLVIHTSVNQAPKAMDPLLLSTSIQKQAEERLGEKWRAKAFPYLGNTVMIAQLGSGQEISELTDECDRFCKYVRHMIGAVVTVGIGQVCGEIPDLFKSYASAREAVSYRVIYGSSRAINMKEIVPQEAGSPGVTNDAQLSGLFKMIRLGSEEDIVKAVDTYLHHASLQRRIVKCVCKLFLFSPFHIHGFALNGTVPVHLHFTTHSVIRSSMKHILVGIVNNIENNNKTDSPFLKEYLRVESYLREIPPSTAHIFIIIVPMSQFSIQLNIRFHPTWSKSPPVKCI